MTASAEVRRRLVPEMLFGLVKPSKAGVAEEVLRPLLDFNSIRWR